MKVLVAEDDPIFRRLLEIKLTMWGYNVIAAENGEAALRMLTVENHPRLALLDWMMPGMEGIEVCRKIRGMMREPYIYIILLTSHQQDEDLVIGMEAGADDYITKPFKHSELRLRLRAGRRIIELQNELLAARDKFRAKASYDSLTGILNHEEILRNLNHELERAERGGECVSVIMADIDFFKKINDTYGHLAGDSVLCSIAARMNSLIRTYDHIGRYGGEEFLIVLPECNSNQAAAFAERLLTCIGNENVDTLEGPIPVTISLGTATNCKGQKLDAIQLIKAADVALYRAKENGRNRVEVA